MANEIEIEKKMAIYRELAAENKNIDVASLMLSALDQARQEEVEQSKKRIAYIVSVGLPPLGLLYAIRYYFSDKPDGKHVTLLCVLFTAISLLFALALGALLFSSAGDAVSNTPEVLNSNMDDLRELLQ